MFKEWAARPIAQGVEEPLCRVSDFKNRAESDMRSALRPLRVVAPAMTRKASKPIRKLAVATFMIFIATTAMHTPVQARDTIASCNKTYTACRSGCGKWTDPQFKRSCFSRCEGSYSTCLRSAAATGGSKVQTPPDPIDPKGGGVRTPPTGGVKGEPKSPPKVNDTRAPLGGGVFGQKPTPSTGGSGTILMKSGGASGPSFRSNGGRR